MRIFTENHSSFPKVDDSLYLKKAIDKFDKGKVSEEELEKIYQETRCRVVRAQVRVGLDVITDGMIDWEDEVSYIALKFDGVKRGDLVRWFDTNFYYRVPIIEEKLWLVKNIKGHSFPKVATGNRLVKPKVVLTGPYTIAKMSKNNAYRNFEDLVFDLAWFIGRELVELCDLLGVIVQINEPAITQYPEDKRLFLEAMKIVFPESPTTDLSPLFLGKTVLSTYFGNVDFLFPELDQEINCDGLGFDLIKETQVIEALAVTKKDLHLGIMDARTTKMEDYEYYAEWLEFFDEVNFENDIYVGPNNGLEFLPWKKAVKKLKNMVNCVEMYKERKNV